MTDNEIIKALECCIDSNCCKEKCPIFDERNSLSLCTSKLSRYALDLINRQKAELEKCAEEQHNLMIEKDELFDIAEKQKAEIERLEKEYCIAVETFNDVMSNIIKSNDKIISFLKHLKGIKAEAIKEFAERLCEDRVSNDPVVIAVKTELKMMERNGVE